MPPKVPFARFWILICGPHERPDLKYYLCLLGKTDFFVGICVTWWPIFTRPNNTPVTFVKNCWWFYISWLRKVKCSLGRGVGGLRRNAWILLRSLISKCTFIAVVDCNMIWLRGGVRWAPLNLKHILKISNTSFSFCWSYVVWRDLGQGGGLRDPSWSDGLPLLSR